MWVPACCTSMVFVKVNPDHPEIVYPGYICRSVIYKGNNYTIYGKRNSKQE